MDQPQIVNAVVEVWWTTSKGKAPAGTVTFSGPESWFWLYETDVHAQRGSKWGSESRFAGI